MVSLSADVKIFSFSMDYYIVRGFDLILCGPLLLIGRCSQSDICAL